jgi:hypothetical protein
MKIKKIQVFEVSAPFYLVPPMSSGVDVNRAILLLRTFEQKFIDTGLTNIQLRLEELDLNDPYRSRPFVLTGNRAETDEEYKKRIKEKYGLEFVPEQFD